MKLIWHIVKKDLFRLRYVLPLWLVLLLSQLVVARLLLSGIETEHWGFRELNMLKTLGSILLILIGYFLAASVVLEDSYTLPESFWMTRPIASVRLFGAKLVTVAALFILLPALIWVPWWTYCGNGPADLARQFLLDALPYGITATAAVLLAMLTGISRRFLLGTLASLPALGVLGYVMSSTAGLPLAVVKAQFCLCAILTLLAAGMVVAGRLWSRKAWLSYAVVVIWMASLPAVLQGWSWPLPRLHLGFSRTELPSIKSVVVTVQAANVPGRQQTLGADAYHVSLRLVAEGLPDDLVWTESDARLRVRWQDDSVTEYGGRVMEMDLNYGRINLPTLKITGSPLPDRETEEHVRTSIIQGRSAGMGKLPSRAPMLKQSQSPLSTHGADFTLRRVDLLRIQQEHPQLTLMVTLTAGRPRVLLDAPLQAGLEIRGDGIRLRQLEQQPVAQMDSSGMPAKESGVWRMIGYRGAVASRIKIFSLNQKYPSAGTAALGWDNFRSMQDVEKIVINVFAASVWRTDHYEPIGKDWRDFQRVYVVSYTNTAQVVREISLNSLMPENTKL